jgi:precorrin-6B methylase 2
MEPINLTIKFDGNWTSAESIRLKSAFDSAMQDDSKLANEVLRMNGMSGYRYRHLINKFIELTPDARYLEIGSWAGSTACSAMYGNKCKVMCIDNWLHFGGPKDQFFQNIDTFGNDNIDFHYAESDYAAVDYSQIGKFNVYLFDGPHEEHHQHAGITITQAALEDVYLLVVDDWNWIGVRNGTLNALTEVGSTIVSSIVIRTTQNEIHPTISGAASEWHNGYFIAVIKK